MSGNCAKDILLEISYSLDWHVGQPMCAKIPIAIPLQELPSDSHEVKQRLTCMNSRDTGLKRAISPRIVHFNPRKKTYLLPSGGCFIAESHFKCTQYQCENTRKIGACSNSRRRCNPDKIPRRTGSRDCRITSCQTRSPGACDPV